MTKTLQEWVVAKALHRKLTAWAAEQLVVCEKASARHCARHPLSDEVKDKIRALYLRGEALCCTKGRANVSRVVDDLCWADFISDRAHDQLGCDGDWKPGGCFHEDGKAKLERILRGE